jgi:hypothetical protein
MSDFRAYSFYLQKSVLGIQDVYIGSRIRIFPSRNHKRIKEFTYF